MRVLALLARCVPIMLMFVCQILSVTPSANSVFIVVSVTVVCRGIANVSVCSSLEIIVCVFVSVSIVD